MNYPYDSQTTTGRSYFSPCKGSTDYVDDSSDCTYMTVTNTGRAEEDLTYVKPEPSFSAEDLPYLADKGRAEKDEPIEEPP